MLARFTLVTSNLPFDEWTSIFGSERLTGASGMHSSCRPRRRHSGRLRRAAEFAGAARIFLRPVAPNDARDGFLPTRQPGPGMGAGQRTESARFRSPPGAVIPARALRPWPASARYRQGGIRGEVPTRVWRRLTARKTARSTSELGRYRYRSA